MTRRLGSREELEEKGGNVYSGVFQSIVVGTNDLLFFVWLYQNFFCDCELNYVFFEINMFNKYFSSVNEVPILLHILNDCYHDHCPSLSLMTDFPL
jgi:hypothetical protein